MIFLEYLTAIFERWLFFYEYILFYCDFCLTNITFKCILYINIYQQNNEKERGLFMKRILSMMTAMAMIFCLFPPVRSFAADTAIV